MLQHPRLPPLNRVVGRWCHDGHQRMRGRGRDQRVWRQVPDQHQGSWQIVIG